MNSSLKFKLQDESVNIPYRVYFPPARLASIDALTPQQKAVFASIMTRHQDGHQREYWAKVLCEYPTLWTAPFLLGLLGDYVIEVLDAVRQNLSRDWESTTRRHVTDNKICLRSLNHRILTYWTVYYRYSPPNIKFLTDYPGYSVAVQLGVWDIQTAPKLLKKARANKLRVELRP